MIELKHISKFYKTGTQSQQVLHDISIKFREHELVAILGTSGSGKTTLLNIIGGLDRKASGELLVNGVLTRKFKNADWDTYRNHHIGFIFQSYNLIPHQSVLSNVELALTLGGIKPQERKRRAVEALTRVGLQDHINKKPNQLSGGQAQRVAIARALVNNPDIILADEPTGALDTTTGIQIMDILKDVSKERLVIMVTHNKELADEYASRVVELKDGAIISDSDPIEDAAPANVSDASASHALSTGAQSSSKADKKKRKRASMSFLTALVLSFHNLMTKKGRTFLTAFAGSIGIIGIAAILALSNGVNNYITKTQRDAMTFVPLVITKNAMSTQLFEPKTTANDNNDSNDPNQIRQKETIKDMFSDNLDTVKKNNLKKFKEFLDSNGGHIKDNSTTIDYEYDIDPVFIKSTDGVNEIVGKTLEATNLKAASQAGFNPNSFLPKSANGFAPISTKRDIIETQYELLKGKWPTAPNEALLTLSQNGDLDDYALYGIGVLNNKDVDDYVKAITTKNTDKKSLTKKKEAKLPTTNFTLDDALKLTYKVIPRAVMYKENKNHIWNLDNSEKNLDNITKDAIEVKVVGIIKPRKGSQTGVLRQGISFSSNLIDIIAQQAAKTPAVKAQLKNPDVDIFTGRKFKDIEDGKFDEKETDNLLGLSPAAMPDLSSLKSLSAGFSIPAIPSGMPAFDPSALAGLGTGAEVPGGALPGAPDMSKLAMKPEDLKIKPEELLKAVDSQKLLTLLKNIPAPHFNELEGITIERAQLEDLKQQLIILANRMVPWYIEHKAEFGDGMTVEQMVNEYMKDPATEQALAKIKVLLGGETAQKVKSWLESYLNDQLLPYLKKVTNEVMANVSKELSKQIAAAINTKMGDIQKVMMQSMAQATLHSMTGGLSSLALPALSQMPANLSALGAAGSLGAQAKGTNPLASFNPKNLTDTLKNYFSPDKNTYDGNLQKLGYADLSDPSAISIFPKNFKAKEKITEAIDTYNKNVTAQGNSDDVITYNDFMKTIFDSVSGIVSSVTAVLIAFVSISLIVSSIMIGIITYISVLERKKEIGILRAMGASKFNIANVFNAETTIEGFIAGIFAIIVVLLVSIPVNSLVEEAFHIENIMSLPLTSALALIVISIALTLLSGLIPSNKAARRDPVEALRSE